PHGTPRDFVSTGVGSLAVHTVDEPLITSSVWATTDVAGVGLAKLRVAMAHCLASP
ncbi:hypothetical protein Ancab_001685, partial [Ancistrocladus abbreviatus]